MLVLLIYILLDVQKTKLKKNENYKSKLENIIPPDDNED
jgi:hypothetical protein